LEGASRPPVTRRQGFGQKRKSRHLRLQNLARAGVGRGGKAVEFNGPPHEEKRVTPQTAERGRRPFVAGRGGQQNGTVTMGTRGQRGKGERKDTLGGGKGKKGRAQFLEKEDEDEGMGEVCPFCLTRRIRVERARKRLLHKRERAVIREKKVGNEGTVLFFT